MDLRKLILTQNDCYKSGRTIAPKGVMWHSTGANNPNLKRYVGPDDGLLGVNKYNNHWNKPGGNACVHAFIGLDKNGAVATYQTLPWNMRGWHAGGNANNTHISFEICEDDLSNKEYFDKVYKEAVELTAYLCKLYSLDPMGDGVIICHKDGFDRGIASNHSDVYPWFNKFGKTMDDVRKDVKALINPTPVINTITFEVIPVKKGERGEHVKKVQAILKGLGYYTMDIDGSAGGGTDKAIIAYQKAKGLEQTKVFDGKCWEAFLNA